jgi:hypothetical protein
MTTSEVINGHRECVYFKSNEIFVVIIIYVWVQFHPRKRTWMKIDPRKIFGDPRKNVDFFIHVFIYVDRKVSFFVKIRGFFHPRPRLRQP